MQDTGGRPHVFVKFVQFLFAIINNIVELR